MNDIHITKNGGVLELRFERPAKKNALTFAMYGALADALRDAESDAAVRVVLFTAAGDAFSSGNDIGDFLAATPSDIASAPPIRFLEALVTASKPIVAAVQGAAVGIGTTMLLHCDLVYAAEEARLSTPFVNLALVPEAASSLLLPRRVGEAVANEMLLLGTAIDARRALALGLVNEVIAAAELRAFAQKKAAELAAKPPSAVRASKALVRGDRSLVLARIREEARLFGERLSSPEAKEAFSAFLERRAPDFTKFA